VNPVPILFLSDSPDCPSGLARIGRDLATRVHKNLSEQFRVGYLGRGGLGGSFPFPTWIIPHNLYGLKTTTEWGSTVIEQVWKEFSRGEPGVVFSIWDPARMIWLTRPEYLQDSRAKDFLLAKPFSCWGYFPVDGHTPNGGLGLLAKEALIGYDRILGYTKYGAHVLAKVIGKPPGCVPYLPHGLDPIWFPRDKPLSRKLLGVEAEDFVVGVVATNQKRKDWGLAATIGQALSRIHGARYRQWWHTDLAAQEWSIPALLNEFDLGKQTTVTFPPRSDEWMACAYSACNVTLAIGAGEGFGYPIVESQACGTPVIHGYYGGGAELLPPGNIVSPALAHWLDGLTNIMRPVFVASDWLRLIEKPDLSVGDMAPLRWPVLWSKWKRWFLGGL